VTRAPLKHFRRADRSLKASVTSLENALGAGRCAHDVEWRLALKKLQAAVAEFARLIGAEKRALDEPHRFQRPVAGIWCTRFGGTVDATKDGAALHPPELQVSEQSAHAAQGGA
jgi:hypothetical protein